MIFDLACRLAERTVQELRRPIRDASLFLFPGRAHEILPKEWEEESVQFFMDNFFLPFPTVAIEDTASCVILIDKEKDAPHGCKTERNFIEIIPIEKSRQNEFVDGEKAPDEFFEKNVPVCTAAVLFGSMSIPEMEKDRLMYKGHVEKFVLACPTERMYSEKDNMRPDIFHSLTQSGLRNIGTAWQEIMYFNSPERFVVEVSHAEGYRQHAKSHIPRSHERPNYTLLGPREIREKMGIVNEKYHTVVTPHHRRKHYRRLESDRFVNKKGKVIVVREAWVGPVEKIVGNKKYRVMLEH